LGPNRSAADVECSQNARRRSSRAGLLANRASGRIAAKKHDRENSPRYPRKGRDPTHIMIHTIADLCWPPRLIPTIPGLRARKERRAWTAHGLAGEAETVDYCWSRSRRNRPAGRGYRLRPGGRDLPTLLSRSPDAIFAIEDFAILLKNRAQVQGGGFDVGKSRPMPMTAEASNRLAGRTAARSFCRTLRARMAIHAHPRDRSGTGPTREVV